jgi:hypothetical protein
VTCDETEEDTESCKTLSCEELKVYFKLDDATAVNFSSFVESHMYVNFVKL